MKPYLKLVFASVCLLIIFYHPGLQAQEVRFLDHNPEGDSSKVKPGISAYNVGSPKDLYIQLNTGKSLVEVLQALAPQMNKEEVTKHGNYQFTFLVDGKMIYQENLGPGAILLEDKVISKPLNVVLISRTRSGLWSINLWDRFITKGGMLALDHKEKNLTIEIRAYLENNGITYSNLLAKGTLLTTRIPPVIDPAKMVPQVILPNSGWELSDEKYNHALITQLNTKIEDQTYRMINGIVVIKKGKLLLEEYFNTESRSSLHDPRSATKSMTGTLVGMAIQDGYLKNERQQLKEFYSLKDFEHYSSKKDSVKLLDFLTMSSAFEGNDDVDSSPGNEDNMYPTPDYIKFALDLPMDMKKNNGAKWEYFTAGTVVLGDILDKNIPGGLEQYAKRKLFQPLGIDTLEWARTPQNKPFTGGGLKMRALDFAKYGQLYQNKGVWKGKRLVPGQWITKTFSHLQTLPADRPGFYGYLFWNKTFTINGKDYEVYYSSGNGGNKIYVFKDIPLVIVITASAYGRSFAHPQVDQMMEQYILPAVL